MIEVVVVKLSDNLPFQYDYLKYVSYERRNRILKYVKEADKKRSLMSELLIIMELSNKLGMSREKVNISYNPYGKPYIANQRNFHFNISHSGSYVVIATSRYKIGVDIERNTKIDISIAKNIFTQNEYQYIDSFRTEDDRICAFYNLWTLKESYVKALGKGLKIPFNAFEFVIDKEIRLKHDKKRKKFLFSSIQLCNYTLALSYQENDITFTYLKEIDIYNYFMNMVQNKECLNN
ncbi:4'-phosphopantetheinyl transferase family protein [Anaerosporobacter faecicola]|uniref:4'-phosphopantetheinyl transferase family protein n=1 Tax=Anaerosporobacter faecicola TaxID=2718714 RepID=UPI001439DEAB|nr:4'-phosphopantetheinyl transferase superfamily protein [Anaerosporobacter faecicola]